MSSFGRSLFLVVVVPVSERPRSLLLSLGGAIQTLAWVLSWARPGPIPGTRWSHPDSPCALFYSVSDPSRSRGGGHPGPSWSHPAPERSFQDRAWTGRNRLLGHFRLLIFLGTSLMQACLITDCATLTLPALCLVFPLRHVLSVTCVCDAVGARSIMNIIRRQVMLCNPYVSQEIQKLI